MKYIVCLLAAFVLFNSFSFQSSNSKALHGPFLVIDTSAANFGIVPTRGTVQHIFILRNTGDSLLRITRIQPGCGCTVASLDDSVIRPGSSTNLHIRLNANHKTPGGFEKSVYVFSNSRDTGFRFFMFYGRFIADSSGKTQR